MQALGLIEVIGYPAAIEGADAALKAANINLNGLSKVGSGIMTVTLYGDVGAVKAAVEAGSLAASKVGTLRASHVIPRVDNALIGTVVKNREVSVSDPEKNDGGDNTSVESGGRKKAVDSNFMNVPADKNSENKPEDMTAGRTKKLTPIGLLDTEQVKNDKSADTTDKTGDIADRTANKITDTGGNTTNNTLTVSEASDNRETLRGSGNKTRETQRKPRGSETKRISVQKNTDNKGNSEDLKKKGIQELRSIAQSLGILVDSEQLKGVKKDELIHLIETQAANKKGDK